MGDAPLDEYEISMTIRIFAETNQKAHDVMNEITLGVFRLPCVDALTAEGPKPCTTKERP